MSLGLNSFRSSFSVDENTNRLNSGTGRAQRFTCMTVSVASLSILLQVGNDGLRRMHCWHYERGGFECVSRPAEMTNLFDSWFAALL